MKNELTFLNFIACLNIDRGRLYIRSDFSVRLHLKQTHSTQTFNWQYRNRTCIKNFKNASKTYVFPVGRRRALWRCCLTLISRTTENLQIYVEIRIPRNEQTQTLLWRYYSFKKMSPDGNRKIQYLPGKHWLYDRIARDHKICWKKLLLGSRRGNKLFNVHLFKVFLGFFCTHTVVEMFIGTCRKSSLQQINIYKVREITKRLINYMNNI